MTYELYTISGAPRPWRVALALVAKGLPFESKVLEASRKEHKAPAFLALNPRGRTPVLVRDGFVLTESLAILAHLEAAHPEPPLFGRSAVETTRIWEQVMIADHDLRDATNAILAPVFQRTGDTPDALLEPAAKLRAELRRLDERLAKAPYLCGETLTAADCVAFPEARLVLRANERFGELMQRIGLQPLDEYAPHVRRWVDRIEAMPGYERAFPTHWR